ncbi:hypothetical protein ACFX12_029420 [Malus domestica]
MSSDGKPQGLYLRPYKGTYLDSFCSSGSALLDKLCPIKPTSESEARQKALTGANLLGSCVLVGQGTSPTKIPTTNIVLARPVGYI